MAANYPGAGGRSTGMTPGSGQAGASCLSASCGGKPEGLEAPGGSVPGDELRGYCSTCRFWLAKAGQAVPGTVVSDLDDGSRHHFYFNPAGPIVHTGNPSLHLGFGGTPWRVRFFDGRVVDTNDLYGEGEIPARFHHLFPPNATLEQLGDYGGRRFDDGPPFHLLAHLEFPADNLPRGGRPSLDPDQLARAAAALDAWYDPGPGGYRAPGRTWDQLELESMYAALEAPTIDAALASFPGAPGTALSTPGQDAQNRALMTELRQRLGRDAPRDPAAQERLGQDDSPEAWRPAAAVRSGQAQAADAHGAGNSRDPPIASAMTGLGAHLTGRTQAAQLGRDRAGPQPARRVSLARRGKGRRIADPGAR